MHMIIISSHVIKLNLFYPNQEKPMVYIAY